MVRNITLFSTLIKYFLRDVGRESIRISVIRAAPCVIAPNYISRGGRGGRGQRPAVSNELFLRLVDKFVKLGVSDETFNGRVEMHALL